MVFPPCVVVVSSLQILELSSAGVRDYDVVARDLHGNAVDAAGGLQRKGARLPKCSVLGAPTGFAADADSSCIRSSIDAQSRMSVGKVARTTSLLHYLTMLDTMHSLYLASYGYDSSQFRVTYGCVPVPTIS
jgi:hypothetical protein